MNYILDLRTMHLPQALLFCAPFFVQNGKCSPFLELTPTLWKMPRDVTNISEDWADFCQCQDFWCHFLSLVSSEKITLLALGGRPQPLKQPSQSQKCHFYKKMNALNDTITSAMSKSAKKTNGEYLWLSVAFVEAWIKWQNCLKNHANVAPK